MNTLVNDSDLPEVPFPTSVDHFLGGRLTIRQPAAGYRAGSDPLFLAAAVAGRGGQRVLDMGCGVGTAALVLLARMPALHVTGIEVQPALAVLARANARANNLAERMEVVEGNVAAPPPGVPRHAFDHVITNPPWYEAGTVSRPEAETKAIGHVEGDADLAGWLRAAVRFLKPRGRLHLVHRADRLGDILAALHPLAVGEVRVFPLWPKPGRAASRVVVTARKDAKTPLEILPGLVLHHEDGRYTAGAEAVLREGAALLPPC